MIFLARSTATSRMTRVELNLSTRTHQSALPAASTLLEFAIWKSLVPTTASASPFSYRTTSSPPERAGAKPKFCINRLRAANRLQFCSP